MTGAKKPRKDHGSPAGFHRHEQMSIRCTRCADLLEDLYAGLDPRDFLAGIGGLSAHATLAPDRILARARWTLRRRQQIQEK
jgi:hypothetical protein